ncbi:MAG: mannitol dehydrogenase family protein [Pseudomonadota bacterium]
MASDPAARLRRSTPAAKAGIVHFGPGAFFRAFNATFTHEAMEAAGGDWGIVAVSLRSATARDQLLQQGGVFTALERGPEGDALSVIGSVVDVLVAPEDPAAVLARMADPAIRIVSLTITEKGYGYDAGTGGLDVAQPDIAADLEDLSAPRSAVGFIVAALRIRHARGLAPFTVLSCDNLPSNGQVARTGVLDFAGRADRELCNWIVENVPFPSTMVDRITPATQPEDIARLQELAGYEDPAMVVHEPFRQWVIEDNFADGRPAWDQAGAQFVTSVEAHETMKLRCLNGTHSALAYLGYLAGHETIAESIAAPGFAAFCQRLWREEIVPTVPQPEGEDLSVYTTALLERYRNPNIRHRTWQIAMDGSQKLPQRILGTLRDHLARDRVPEGLCLVVAGWMRYVGGTDERGQPIDVRDPLATRLRHASDAAPDPAGKVAALLDMSEVFGTDLTSSPRFREAVSGVYARLVDAGAAQTVRAYSGF